MPTMEVQAVSNPMYELDRVDIEDINVGTAEEDYSKYSKVLETASLLHYLTTLSFMNPFKAL